MPATETPLPRVGATDPALPNGSPMNLAAWRELLNCRRYLRGSGWGTFEGEDRVVVGGDAATPTLAVGQVEAATVRDSDGQWWPAFAVAQTVSPGALAASTIHYLYLRAATDGTITYVVSTTAPTGCYRATGDELQRHVATFATGLLGFPLPAVVRQGSGRYITSSGRGELVALAPGAVFGGTGGIGRKTTWTSVSLTALVPPSATTAWVMAKAKRAAADPAVELWVRRSSADGGHLVAARAGVSGGGVGETVDTSGEGLVQVPLLSQAFEYELTADVTDDPAYGATFTVVGWE